MIMEVIDSRKYFRRTSRCAMMDSSKISAGMIENAMMGTNISVQPSCHENSIGYLLWKADTRQVPAMPHPLGMAWEYSR